MDNEWMTYCNPTIKSYADCERLWGTCRNKQKGKPIKGWCRLFKVDDVYELRYEYYYDLPIGQIIAKILPDNTIILPSSTSDWSKMHQSLSMALRRAIPIETMRVATGKYYVFDGRHIGIPKNPYSPSNHGKFSFEYYGGITFNAEGKCINPRYSTQGKVNPSKRRVWLQLLKQFKRGLKARAKVGALQKLAEQVAEKRKEDKNAHWRWNGIEWDTPKNFAMLIDCLEQNKYTSEFLYAYVEWASPISWWGDSRQPVEDKVLIEQADKLLNKYSFKLRKHFGVFLELPKTAEGNVKEMA